MTGVQTHQLQHISHYAIETLFESKFSMSKYTYKPINIILTFYLLIWNLLTFTHWEKN